MKCLLSVKNLFEKPPMFEEKKQGSPVLQIENQYTENK